MPARARHRLEDELAQFDGELPQMRAVEPAQIGGEPMRFSRENEAVTMSQRVDEEARQRIATRSSTEVRTKPAADQNG